MKLRNNNRQVIRLLSRADYAHNKFRNWLMIGAVATTVLVLFCVFSFMKGRIDAEYLMEIRHNGQAVTTMLDRPTNLQKKQIERLSYIEKTGKVHAFSEGRTEGQSRFVGVVADQVAYTDMLLPAYSDVEGSYPKRADELMLSLRGLAELGITKPKLGMAIPVEIYLDKGKSALETFKLSGFYTDYVHPIEGPPIGFFSESYLHQWGGAMNQATALLIQQKNWYPGEDVEKRLYQDIETIDETQRFESDNSVNYNVIRRTVGGYDIALISIGILFVCVFLLNYNIMNISINQEVRYFGLLKTIGATNRQIRKTIYQQFAKIAGIGLLLGSGISFVLILGIAPRLLANFYLNNYGLSSQMMQFDPFLLVGSLLVAVIVSFVSILFPAYKAGKISPMESLTYIGPKVGRRKTRKGKRGTKLLSMAWRNMWRNKRATLLSMTSIFLGLGIALSSIMVVTALDYTNNIKASPDFELKVHYSPDDLEGPYDDSFLAITKEEAAYLQSLDGVEKAEVIYGGYIRLNPDEAVWEPYFKGWQSMSRIDLDTEDGKQAMEEIKSSFYATVLTAEESYLDALEMFVKENKLTLDMAGLRQGTSVISTDGDYFSEKLMKNSVSTIGQTVQLSDETAGKESLSKKFGGYVNPSVEGFPDKHISMKIGPELLIREASFDELGISKRPLNIRLYVDEEKEPTIKKKLKKFIENKELSILPSEQDSKLPYLSITSDRLAAAQDEIKTMQIAMYSISFLLISLGLVNYINATISSLLSRRSEFAVMESIGMTRKQLRSLLVLEGLLYSGFSSILLLTLGSGGIVLLFKLIRSRLGYAQFFFPYLPMGVIICSLIIICISLPLLVYRRLTNQSIIERLRETTE
ncbi:hypothetical protein IGI37_000917 [Enterococcus sp. AZ194]|uniref:ABC transporter permease n=1 Tax=Enterococcus sp. AZ194 TaxID=2774629 RepID=UPI003F229D30